MKAQLYWKDAQLGDDGRDPFDDAKPAQPVISKGDFVSGFIVEVDPETRRFLFCLFEPLEAEHLTKATIVKETVTTEEWKALLTQALHKNPEMEEWWVNLAAQSLIDEP